MFHPRFKMNIHLFPKAFKQNKTWVQLLIRALMFRQDYRINRIFLPFLPVPLKAGKKGKKHPPSSREVVHSLRQQTVMQGKEHPLLIPRIFSAEAELRFHGFIWCFHKANAATREINQVNPVNPVRKHFGFMYSWIRYKTQVVNCYTIRANITTPKKIETTPATTKALIRSVFLKNI